MEARIALAVYGFAQSPYGQVLTEDGSGLASGASVADTKTWLQKDGYTVVVGSPTDDVYVQQVATAPQKLLYADNGSFFDTPGVDGDYGEIPDINSIRDIHVTNARLCVDRAVAGDNYPVFDFTGINHRVTTRFVLQQGGIDFTEFSAVLRYTQSDGTVSRWGLVGATTGLSLQNISGGNSFGAVSGPAPRAGDMFVYSWGYTNPGSDARGQTAISISWQIAGTPATLRPVGQQPVSPFTSVPILESVFYAYQDETVGIRSRRSELGIAPSAAANVINGETQPTLFTLPGAAGIGSAGIVPGTLQGTISIDGASYPFSVESNMGNRLVFGGGRLPPSFGDAGSQLGTEYVLFTASGKPKAVRGSVDFATGVISLTFTSYRRDGGRFTSQAPGPVTLDARYAVYDAGDPSDAAFQPGSLTVFAGHDITGEFTADLLPHGATINVDSPLVMRPALTDGDISLRATNVNIDAKLLANDRLDIGGSIAPRGTMLRQASAGAAIGTGAAAGRVVNMFIPPGLEGAGYVVPPLVTIAGPNDETNASLGTVTVDRDPASPTFGQVTGIQIIVPGSGYLSPPAIVIQPPSGGGTTATATATLDTQGRVTGITITSGGSGYETSPTAPGATIFRPQAEAVAILDAFGRISGFTITNAGVGYTARPDVTIAPPTAQRSAMLGSPLVDPTTFDLVSIPVTDSGYGYTSPPQVWIAPPPEATGGTQATAVVLPADVDAEGRVLAVTIVDPGSGYFTTDAFGNITSFIPVVRILAPFPVPAAEVVNFNASVAANIFEIHVGDDTATARERGTMTVSQTGSLSRQFFLGAESDSIFVQAIQSDVVIEGTIWVDKQTYLMQSKPEASDLAPFVLTTTSPATGASVGTIRGGTVGITLANDAPTSTDGAVAFNDVDLHTDIDSFRIRAATSAGVMRSDPFPYELRVMEDNSLAIEAVAASSFPITLAADQNMLFNASLATASDVNIQAGSLFTLSAPVSTTKGRIGVVAQNITVENSLRVTGVDADETREDILLEASGGSITVAGLVSAVNNVTLRQLNRQGPNTFEYSNRDPAAINDNSTVVRSITVNDAFTFEDLDVAIDIDHTFVSDLSAVLVAPDGTRVRLFTRIGGGGDNFTGTIFDSEAATPVSAGTAPFTGRFRPQDSLVPLYARDARGTWRLEVTDSALADVGALKNFTLLFSSPTPGIGRISGPARVRAGHLTIDAEGIVGNPDVAPGVGSYYLRTNVNSLSGRAGESISIDEVNDISVTDLRAGGLVSLRANGVDPLTGPNAGKAALTVSLADVPAIDVNAPAGSIDVVNNAPRTIILGNADALRRGRAISMLAGGDVRIRSTGGATRGEIFALDAPLAGSGARTVRYLYTFGDLPSGAVYAPRSPGTTASTISGSGTLSGVLGGSTVGLRVNDRILVDGTFADGRATGIYTVTRLGGVAGWLLTRSADSDTAAELPTNTIVRVTDGSSTGFYRLTYTTGPSTPFARCPITVAAETLRTNIGSDDPNDMVTFVVSTAGGTNTAAGSLGKTILLRQANDTSGTGNENQKMDFMFSGQVLNPIRLTQQLPLITESFVIDGNTSYNPPGSPGVNRPRITIDGSRISRTREGNAVTTSTVVNGLEVSGSGAAGVVLSNMTVAGFTKGAAVQVQSANTVLVNAMTIGSSEFGLRVPNQFGVRVAGASSEVTVLNSTITASTTAGVRVEGTSTNVVFVGNTIGVAERDNSVGVQFAGSGSMRVGVEPILPLATIAPVNATRVNATTFTLPISYRTAAVSLFVGLGVTGPGITASDGKTTAVIQSVTTNSTTGITTVAISDGTVTDSGRVTFGNFAATVLGSSTLTLPAAISPGNLFLGQEIAGTGIPAGTRITGISRGAATTSVTLSAPMTRSGVASITFPGPNSGAPRNVIRNNLVGVELLGSGAAAIVNTSIINNALDGVRITNGLNTIGRADRSRSAFSNVIFGNGGFGIVLDGGSSTRADTVALANQQIVRGNFLGVTSGNGSAAANTKGNIGLRYTAPPSREELYPGEGPGFRFRPDTVTAIDADGNQHNGTNNSPSASDGPLRRGVPPPPPPPRR